MGATHPKILIVEDEPDISSALQSYLGRRGFYVSTTASGLEALSLIEISKPNVVILDFSLNDLNGREVLKKLRERDKETKVVVITGQMLPDAEVEVICEMGVAEYFHKPVILERLGAVISRLTGHNLIISPEYAGAGISQVVQPKESLGGKDFHKLVNLLGVIRSKCENFLLNKKDGLYKDESESGLLEMSAQIILDVTSTVDDALDVVQRLRVRK
ncbi:MAG: response regulator [Candidatus Omnitrophota bacterium]